MIETWKQYQTRSGLKVRIYATDGIGFAPVHGAIEIREGKWVSTTWRQDGHHYDYGYDLIEVKDDAEND